MRVQPPPAPSLPLLLRCSSLGDFAFKHPQALISADPHVEQAELTPSDKLVVLASDGVTDVLPDDDMLEAALRAIEQVSHPGGGGGALAATAPYSRRLHCMHSSYRTSLTGTMWLGQHHWLACMLPCSTAA